MQDEQVLNRLDLERRNLVRDGESIEVLPSITRLRSSDGSQHSVVYSSLDLTNADAMIQEQIEHYRQLNVSFEWKLYSHDSPADMLERLRARGFDIGAREAVLVFDLSTRPPWIDEPSEIHTIRVDRIEDVAIFGQLAEEIFGKDYAFTSGELSEAIRRGSTQHRGFVGYTQDTAVSVGRLYTHPQSHFGGLYGGGTFSAFRGRGAYRAVVAARARDAISLGAKYLIVDALPTSQPILQRLGFVRIADTWPCTWHPR